MDRRAYLALVGALGAAAVAGCSENEPEVESADDDGDLSGPDESSENNSSDTDGDSGSDDTDDSDSNQSIFELGETAVFSDESQEIEFRAHNARLTNVLVSSTGGSLFSDTPDSDLFLLIDATVTNVGEETAAVPGTVDLVVDSSQYEQSFVAGVGVENGYSNFTELRPGVEQTGTLIFSIPSGGSEARLFVEWGTIETVTGQWQFDLSNVERDVFDYSDNSVGETIQFGTEQLQYQLTVQDIELAESYTYEGFSGTQRERASSGQQWAIATIEAENTGNRTVSVPSTFSMRLVADGQQYDQSIYLGDDGYSGGNLGQGSAISGLVVFEVPDTVSRVSLEIDLTQQLTAVWDRD